jgi:hypothetical protein
VAKIAPKGHRLDADYTEELVGFALESFLTLICFPWRLFSIEPFSRSIERSLGADARLDGKIKGFRPFYMQFKRPSAYPDFSDAQFIKDRKRFNLETSPHSLYFGLREKQPKHSDFQHNILFELHQKLRNQNIGDAAYICPLFLNRSSYRFHLHLSGLRRRLGFWRFDPWELGDLLLRDGDNTIAFDRVPVLAEHIAVPPHAKVTSAKHRYSFTEAGDGLCFHSPKSLPDGAQTLAYFLKEVSKNFFNDAKKIRMEDADKELKQLIESIGIVDPDRVFRELESIGRNPIGSWFAWGDYLRREYKIEQYALVSWQDDTFMT